MLANKTPLSQTIRLLCVQHNNNNNNNENKINNLDLRLKLFFLHLPIYNKPISVYNIF